MVGLYTIIYKNQDKFARKGLSGSYKIWPFWLHFFVLKGHIQMSMWKAYTMSWFYFSAPFHSKISSRSCLHLLFYISLPIPSSVSSKLACALQLSKKAWLIVAQPSVISMLQNPIAISLLPILLVFSVSCDNWQLFTSWNIYFYLNF